MLGFIDRMFDRKMPPAEPVPLNAVFASEVGLVRKDNQDNAMVSVRTGVFCVADGMGGGAEGAKASEMVCEDL